VPVPGSEFIPGNAFPRFDRIPEVDMKQGQTDYIIITYDSFDVRPEVEPPNF